ncbi:dynamin family protein [Nocardia callitridis]|uniref:Isoniazid-induced dynamin-like GTPase IniA n=1 Tax=Nocardia callitridis TaxID=648753 RepID=A0ABP9KZW0_9NOCA
MSAAAGLKAATVKHPDVMAPLIRILDELREQTRFVGREDLGSRLNMVRARVSDPRVRIVVVGSPKNGMSTLVNSVVGTVVSATDSDLSVPVIVEYGPEPTATLVRNTGNGRTERTPVDPLHPGPALATPNVVRAEFTQPSPLLADGVVVMDAPGGADDATTWSMVAAADAVLYVGDASAELTMEQIAQLQRVERICPTVICVLNKIDLYPHWGEVQQRNRELLDEVGLSFAVAPVSAEMHKEAGLYGSYQRDIESGVPQLIDHLRDYVVARADAVAVEAAVRDIRLVADHLVVALRTEAEAANDPRRRGERTAKLKAARDQAEQLRQSSASWQVTLTDGCAELMADVEHDLRSRLRALVRDTEAEITKSDPAHRWKEFGAELDGRICDAVEENFELAHFRAVDLSEEVAGRFPADNRAVQLPDLRLADPAEVLESVQPIEPLESAKTSVTQQALSVLRGSYGGLLMVGVITSLLGLSLVNWYSGGAALLLGINALFEDRRNRQQRRRAEAKVAVARLVDDVVFQMGKESRNRLRTMQRVLRDHFTEIAADVARSADDALRAAEQQYGEHGERRGAEIGGHLTRVRGLRERADALVAG